MLPLSFAQRRLWFLERVEGAGATYLLPLALRLRGPLRVTALRSALGDVVARHEPLRTVFREADDEPYQDVLDAAAGHPGMTVVACGPDRLDEELAAAAAVPIAICEAELPLRATLFETGPEDHVLLMVVHHTAADGWSVDALLCDLSAAYRSRAERGVAPSWDQLPVQYADFTLWQRELLGDPQDPGSTHAVQSAFWSRTLSGLSGPLSLPVDRPRRTVAGHRGASVPFHCDTKLHHGVTELARTHRCTSFMVLQAALCVLLSRLGAGTDIAVGSAVSGRVEEALDDLVGFFVNTVVLRTDLSGDPDFAEVLRRVREADLDAFAHQDLPFDLVVEAVNPVRSLAHNPLFQVMVSFESDAPAEPDFGEVRATVRPLDPLPTAKTDLTFQLVEHLRGGPQGIDGHLEYACDLFDAATAESVVARLLTVLEAVTADPSLRVSEIGLLTDAEYRLVVTEWNATERALPVTALPEALAARAARTPDAPAVVDGPRTLTYAELHERADRLAAHLDRFGAGPGTVVALALPRSAEFVVAVLAVLRTGSAYLPLDPEHPAERLAHMLRDAASPCVLTDRATRAALPGGGPPAVFVDEPLPAPPEVPGAWRRAGPGDPAYVIYTSGSTGLPKGVVVPHAAIDNRLRWMQDAFPLTAADRVLHKTSCGFDVSVWELLWPLREGAVLVVAAPGEQRDPARLIATVRSTGVTVAHFVPSMLDHFLAEPEAASCAGLRRVFCSGEALPRETADTFHRLLPGTALENLYGPTEAAVDVTWHPCRAGESGPVPIGKPVYNTRTYVLDETLRPCPPGLPGELYLAGVQLAKGYLGRGALTASRFVADPFGPPGSRMYRTGDVARWRADGSLEYLGREDTQVKLHGQRLELGEVESVLAAGTAVGSACALVRSDNGEQRLVAYVTPARGAAGAGATPGGPQPDRLREHLAERLPAYMLPSDIVVVDRFPLTANGKLDRGALPPPAPRTGRGRAPGTALEQGVLEVFRELLGTDGIGVDDDFFRAGGTSMLAIRLARRLRPLLGTELPVQAVFRHPTAAALARRAGLEAGTPDGSAALLPLRPHGTGLPLFLLHPGTGFGWCYFRLLEHLDTDRPVYALQARGLGGEDGATGLPASVGEMADDYVRQIRQIQPSGPYHLFGWSFGGLVAHAVATALRAADEAVDLLVVLDGRPVTEEEAGRVHASAEEPDAGARAEALAEALRGFFDGAPPLSAAQDGVDDALVAQLRESFPPLSHAGPREVRAAVEVAVNNIRLMNDFVPGRFDGDLVLVAATDDGTPRDTGPGLGWDPYVGGRITVLDAGCGHYEMLGRAVADVGRLLSRILTAPGSARI
ncbi:amino acid adenylation domain-containing protein [Streptomyces sp. NPDC002908]|uniref:non-ribosomal peptide synthetase n=1 Tax=Streptomyces sp. NPDC002908 TaxID=3364670 RepID=UPI003690BFC0